MIGEESTRDVRKSRLRAGERRVYLPPRLLEAQMIWLW